MTERRTRKTTEKQSLWQKLDDSERSILFCASHVVSPVSIDTLCSLCDAPATKVLHVIEELKRRKVIHERSSYPKGTYFFQTSDLMPLIEEPLNVRDPRRVLKRLINFHISQDTAEEQKTLMLAILYRKLGDSGDGLAHIAKAAQILKDRGELDEALVCFNYLANAEDDSGLTGDNVDHVLAGLLGKLHLSAAHLDTGEVQDILTRVKAIAERHRRTSFLARVHLDLGFHHLIRNENKRAEGYLRQALKLGTKLEDQSILKTAGLLMAETMHWKGEANRTLMRYEDTIGEVEEFGNDETALVAKARQGLWYVVWGKLARGIGIIEAVRAKAHLLNLQPTTFFCDLMAAHAYLELRKVREAEFYLERSSTLPLDRFGPFGLRIMNLIKAYILFRKGDYEGAFECHATAVKQAGVTQIPNHKAGWVFEYIDGLEKRGFVHDEVNYDSEVHRTVGGDDIHMKGVGLRYRALRAAEHGKPCQETIADLKKSEEYLRKAGAEMELARTRMALGDVYLRMGNSEFSRLYREKAGSIFTTIESGDLFPEDLVATMPPQKRIESIVEAMISINESLGAVRMKSPFLERALSLAMDFTMATRGAFFEADSDRGPRIAVSRNLDPTLLHDDQLSVMNRVVSSVGSHGIEAFMPGMKEPFSISDDEMISKGITSLLCVPARLGGRLSGCLYLDNRLGGEPFARSQLPYVRLLCSQIAVSLSNIESYGEIKELKDRFEEEALFHREEMGFSRPLEAIIGKSEGIETVKALIRKVAPTDSSVLVMGETGVGKELVAKAIHNLSRRKDGPLIPANLASFPQELVASELFGYEKGAFTGAKDRHRGRFELADGGTLFLDEVGDLPPGVQVKLLRVLQEGIFERLGSEKPIRSNFRVIAMTNRDLAKEVEKGTFRQDLYYRLNVFPIAMPPLRERKGDIPLIARHFLDKYNQKMNKKIQRIPAQELKRLLYYHWPGNVRELEHFIERAVIISDGTNIDFSELDRQSGTQLSDYHASNLLLKDVEREHTKRVLRLADWKVNGPGGAASMLGLKPTTLFSLMKRLGIRRRYDES